MISGASMAGFAGVKTCALGFKEDVINEVVVSFKVVETAVAAVATNACPHWKKELTHLENPDSSG